MKIASIALLAVAAMLSAAIGVRSEDAHADDGVQELTAEAFRKEVAESRPMFINFYTSWCKHCQQSASMYAKLARAVEKRTDLDVKVVKMNVEKDANKGLAEEIGVNAYPTFRLYLDGKHEEYHRQRLVPDMLRWIERKTGKGIVELTSREEVNKFIASEAVAIVGFFQKPQSQAAKVFHEVAKGLDQVVFGTVSKKELMQAFRVEDGTMSLFKKFDEGRMDFPLAVTPSSVRRLLQGAMRPLVSEYGVDDTFTLFDPTLNANRTLLAVFLSRKAGHFGQYMEALRVVAIENPNCTFMTVNADDKDSQNVLGVFEVTNTSVPAMRLLDFNAVKKYKPVVDSIIQPDVIRAFLHGVYTGVIKPADEAEEVPENWDAAAVKVLVSSTFEAFAFDGRRHALVFFTNDYCPHCRAVQPMIEEVAEMYAGQTMMVVASINMRKNSVDGKAGVAVEGFPTIVVYPKNKKESPVVFKDERSVESLVAFVQKHTGLKPSPSSRNDEDSESKDSSSEREEL